MNLKTADRSAVLLIADGLRPSSMGPYGNTWFDTHFINRLASESLLFEQCISDTPDIQLGLRGIFGGQHCCEQEIRTSGLLNMAAESEIQTVLVTSNLSRVQTQESQWDRIVEIPLPANEELCRDLTDTALANFFAATIELVRESNEHSLLVIDCPAFTTDWDAPYQYRENLSDEEDPEPTDFVRPPSRQFNPTTDDPDELLDFQTAYNAQMILFDQMVGLLLDEVDKSECFRNSLFCLTSTRSFPLGEHGVGWVLSTGFVQRGLESTCDYSLPCQLSIVRSKPAVDPARFAQRPGQ